MRNLLFASLLLATVGHAMAADEVISVPSAEHLVVSIDRIPVRLTLADISVPQRGDIPAQALAQVTKLVKGKSVQVIYKDEFGTDDTGTGRVHIKVGSQHVNSILVSEGLAVMADDAAKSSYMNLVKFAQEDAQKGKKGVWGMAAGAEESESQSVAAAPKKKKKKSGKAKGDFVGELNGKYYYAKDDPRVSSINERRRIYYQSKSAAQRAGKKSAPEQVNIAGAGIDQAKQLQAEGERIYSEAIAAGNTSKRDDLYGEAFVALTKAMQVWSNLAEKNPDDAEIAEGLRRTMQLRYGAMKQRRP